MNKIKIKVELVDEDDNYTNSDMTVSADISFDDLDRQINQTFPNIISWSLLEAPADFKKRIEDGYGVSGGA